MMTTCERLRLERGANHLHQLGARAVAEFLSETAAEFNCAAYILQHLAEYERSLTAAKVRSVGGHRFPPRPLRLVEADS
jgi:hypothetical protein